MKFSSCSVFLELCLFQLCFSGELFKLFPYFLILLLHVLQVTLSSVEVMLVLSAVVSSVVLLYYLCLLIEKFALLIFVFKLLIFHKLATANVSSPDSLYFQSCPLFNIKRPLDFEHPPIFLNYNSCRILFVPKLLSFIQHFVIGIH